LIFLVQLKTKKRGHPAASSQCKRDVCAT
jgi:hypothetical protein